MNVIQNTPHACDTVPSLFRNYTQLYSESAAIWLENSAFLIL